MAVNTPPKAHITKYRELGDAKLEVVARELTFLETKNWTLPKGAGRNEEVIESGASFPPSARSSEQRADRLTPSRPARERLADSMC
jgi:hypothetical protein